MNISTLLKQATGSGMVRPRGCPQKRKKPLRWRPSLEHLETRVVPSGTDYFSQAENGDPPIGDLSWINGILNDTHTTFFEGMSTLQRVFLESITGDQDPGTAGNQHVLNFEHLAAKSGSHAYDFLTSWDQAVAATNVIAPGAYPSPIPLSEQCEPGPGAPGTPAEFQARCEALHTSGFFIDVAIPDMTAILGDSVQSRINAYEGFFGNRTLRIYGDQPITGGSMTFNGYSAQNEALYTLTWTSNSSVVVIEFGAHLAQGQDFLLTGVGYGAGEGAGSIQGGPYHVKLKTFDGAKTGSQDNQIMSDAVAAPPNFIIDKSGPELSKVGDQVTYTFTLTHTGEKGSANLNLVSLSDDKLGDLADDLAAQAPQLLTLSPGETGSFDVTFTIPAGADPFVNTVTAVYSIDGLSVLKLTRTDTHSVNLFQPEITLTKVGNKSLAAVGDTIVYTYTSKNTGSPDSPPLENVVVTDDNGTPGNPGDDFNPKFTGGDDGDGKLELGETWTYTSSRLVVTGDSDPLVNTAKVSSNPVGFPNQVTASATFQVQLFQPAIDIDKTGPDLSKSGDDVTYTYKVRNVGSADSPGLENVVVTDDNGSPGDPSDDFSPGFVNGDSNGNGKLDLGETWTYSATRTIPLGAPDPFTNRATVTATSVGSVSAVADNDTHTIDLFRPAVDVQKTVVGGPASVLVGSTIQFQFIITNLSDGDLTTPALDDPNNNTPDLILDAVTDAFLDAGLPVGGKLKDIAIANGAGVLDFKESVTFTVNYTVQQSDFPSITNTVSVLYHPFGFPNPVSDVAAVTQIVDIPVDEGRMTGGGSIFVTINGQNVRVTHGFQLHCAQPPAEINNRLQINIHNPVNSNFHLLTLVSVDCRDVGDPPFQAPPTAPIDTMIGVGLGRFSGDFGGVSYRKADARVNFILTDGGPEKGEPGLFDTFTVVITVLDKNQDGNANDPVVVLDSNGAKLLDRGNHQSHTEIKRLLTNTALAIQREIQRTLDQLDNPNLSANKAQQIVDNLLVLFQQFEDALNGSPLTAEALGVGTGQPLTFQELQPILQEAIAHWRAEITDPQLLGALDELTVRIANLPENLLGLATGQVIWIDQDAAGWGWSLDGMPGRMDLHAAVTHELGHVLGLEHSEHGVMAEALAANSHTHTFTGGPDQARALVAVANPLARGADHVAVVEVTAAPAAMINDRNRAALLPSDGPALVAASDRGVDQRLAPYSVRPRPIRTTDLVDLVFAAQPAAQGVSERSNDPKDTAASEQGVAQAVAIVQAGHRPGEADSFAPDELLAGLSSGGDTAPLATGAIDRFFETDGVARLEEQESGQRSIAAAAVAVAGLGWLLGHHLLSRRERAGEPDEKARPQLGKI